jgi:hypothetical protein
MLIRLLFLFVWSATLSFASLPGEPFEALPASSLEKIVKEGWEEQNQTLQTALIKAFQTSGAQIDRKITTPVIYERDDRMPKETFLKIALPRKDLNAILAYTHYLESIGKIEQSIDYRLRIIKAKEKLRKDLMITLIMDMVYDRCLVNAFAFSLEQGYYTTAQQCRIVSVLKKGLNLDKERFFKALESEKEWMLQMNISKEEACKFAPTLEYKAFLTQLNKYKDLETRRVYKKLESAMRKETPEALKAFDHWAKTERESLLGWEMRAKLYAHAFYVRLYGYFAKPSVDDMDFLAHYIAKMLSYVAMPKLGNTYLDWLKTVKRNHQLIQKFESACLKK